MNCSRLRIPRTSNWVYRRDPYLGGVSGSNIFTKSAKVSSSVMFTHSLSIWMDIRNCPDDQFIIFLSVGRGQISFYSSHREINGIFKRDDHIRDIPV
jgi:hypothetical protein